MKKLFLGTLSILFLLTLFMHPSSAEAAVRVRGYYKPSTGTYVQSYYRSNPNSTRYDNYSTRGNYNPYTGKSGTINPYSYSSRYRY